MTVTVAVTQTPTLDMVVVAMIILIHMVHMVVVQALVILPMEQRLNGRHTQRCNSPLYILLECYGMSAACTLSLKLFYIRYVLIL